MKSHSNSVDLVIPFHKVDKYLLSAAKSASNSINIELSMIFIDDREHVEISDNLILGKIRNLLSKKKIDYTFHKTSRRGYANALNESKPLIRSSYVAILNSDDLISRKRLSVQINKLQEGYDICICKLKKFTFVFPLPALLGSLESHYCSELLLLGAYGADASLVTRKELWQNDFQYDCDIPMADWEMALRCFPLYRVTMVPKSLYFYRMHKRQVSRKSSQELDVSLSFFRSWSLLSQRVGLPEIDISQVSTLTTPWNTSSEISNDGQNQILLWLESFQKVLVLKNIKNDLIKRRLILFRLQGFKVQISIRTSIRMILDFLWLCSLRQSPRINRKAVNQWLHKLRRKWV